MKAKKISESELQDFVDVMNAREVLKRNGYFTENLWQVADVQADYQCTEQEAQDLLYRALTNEDVMQSVWFAIRFEAEKMNLKNIQDEN